MGSQLSELTDSGLVRGSGRWGLALKSFTLFPAPLAFSRCLLATIVDISPQSLGVSTVPQACKQWTDKPHILSAFKWVSQIFCHKNQKLVNGSGTRPSLGTPAMARGDAERAGQGPLLPRSADGLCICLGSSSRLPILTDCSMQLAAPPTTHTLAFASSAPVEVQRPKGGVCEQRKEVRARGCAQCQGF